MADREVVEYLLVDYLKHNAETVAQYIIDRVHADLGMHTEVSQQDIANSLRKLFADKQKPKGIVFKEI